MLAIIKIDRCISDFLHLLQFLIIEREFKFERELLQPRIFIKIIMINAVIKNGNLKWLIKGWFVGSWKNKKNLLQLFVPIGSQFLRP